MLVCGLVRPVDFESDLMLIVQRSVTAGLIALLDDPDVEIRSYAIDELNNVVSLHWAEISEHIATM